MPDGKIAECYAENVAEGIASPTYPLGFKNHYWKPQLLSEPARMKERAGIFVGSMADVFGAWVPDEQVQQVLDACRNAPQHIFFMLTKNAPRLLKFEFPPNVWVGASSPPDFMFGKPLNMEQRERMMRRTLKVLTEVKASVRWMSIEPLSHDYSHIFHDYPTALTWAVIGAASDGKRKFPPSEADLRNTLEVLDAHDVGVFYKGNMRSLPYAAANWREAFPDPDRPALPSAVVASSATTDPESVSQFKQGDHHEIEREPAQGSPQSPQTDHHAMSADPDPIPPTPVERVEPDYADPFALPGNARVLSLWQPWATLLMIEQGKRIETRSWRTPFRGTLVIHAAKEWNKDTRQIANSEPFTSVLRANGYDPNALPLGVALGTVQLENCVRTEDVRGVIGDQERAFGDFDDGRFGWLTSAPRLFRDPLPVAGEQGLKEWANYLAKIAPKAEAPAGLFLGQYVVVPDKDPALFHGVIRKLQDGEAMIDFNQQAVWAPYADVKPHPRHITTVYTARVDSRDSDALDITVKSASTPEGKFFAPTWDMVNGVKSGAISEAQYTKLYEDLLRGRYAENAGMLKKMLHDRRRIVFTCYCAAGDFCHRHLAVNVLEKIGAKFGFTIVSGGELEPPKPGREEATVQLSLFDMKTYA